jgi:hypothetical protein
MCAFKLVALALAPCAHSLLLQQVPLEGIKKFSTLSNGGWDNQSLSGPGSRPEVARPFVEFFDGWLRDHSGIVTSIVEASAGHWPSGWQQFMPWPALDYVGIDLLPEVIQADQKFLDEQGKDRFGLKSMMFMEGDMLKDDTLPPADLFFTKDTFIHFPNKFIQQFLNQTALACPPKYKYMMFVHDWRPRNDYNFTRETHNDIPKFGMYHGFDLRRPPFSVPVDTVFEWRSPSEARPHTRLVQVLNTSKVC